MTKIIKILLCVVIIMTISAGMWSCTSEPEVTAPETPSEVNTTPEEGQKTDNAPETRAVTDIAGRTVEIPSVPGKIATMPGPTYEMVFMLGAKDQIGLVREDHATVYPLALLTNPALAGYTTIANVGPQTPVNVEEFISKGVDLVIYYNIPQELEKFDMAGIPAVVVNWSPVEPTNLEETIADQKNQILFTSELLGGEAPERYSKWCEYMDETVDFIQSRTSQIPESEFPVVYWGNSWGTNILATWVTTSNEHIVNLCGGKLVGPEKGGKFPEITLEQLIAWNPDVIIVDNHGHDPVTIIEQLRTDAEWASLPAVKNDRLHRIPSGVFFLDKGTSRVVYYLWLAKQLHPDVFEDVDLIAEMQYYFQTFYDYDMTVEEAEQALQGWGK